MSWVTTIAEERRRARKPHRCIWCGQLIEVGTVYEYVRCVFEGDPQSNHYHLECSAAAEELAKEHDDGFDAYDNERPNRVATAVDA